MATYEFKSESKRMLDLMINSIYTHKEIFLREIISNASDALDKLYYKSLSDDNIEFDREKFYIRITPDKDARTLTITDGGIGMNRDELEENLGTIAKSGSLAFKSENEKCDDVDIIGQFGVGFYSAFMVGKSVTVKSRKFGSDEAFKWYSEGADGYEIEPCDKDTTGTEIIIALKDNTDDENYDTYLEEYTIRNLIKKYSDYIKYPIKMMVTKQKLKDATEEEKKKDDYKPEYESYSEDDVLNSMVPLWRKNKSELSDDDYNNFYKEKFFDYENPLKTIHTSADGMLSYTALLFIPSHAPFDYFTKDYKKGLSLYTNGVMIMDKCEDLLPDYFGFVKGLVDSADLSLNISREILQHDRQLKTIAAHLKKKIKSELLNMQKNDRETYDKFYDAFKRPLKFGVYDNYGAEKDFLSDLLMFYSSTEKKQVTLGEYIDRMKDGQEFIYYASGETIEQIDKQPRVESVKDMGYEILYLTEDVDEFAIKILSKYKEKEFKSVASAELGGEDEKTKAEESVAEETSKDLFAAMKDVLGDKVVSVKPTVRLKNHPVCITSEGEISLEMEKILGQMPNGGAKAQRVLEINIKHPLFEKLKAAADKPDELKKLTEVVYGCALLAEGMNVENAADFADSVCDLI
ncbi:MAG: molecular chaperone HtpG [Eubacteriales bacterium]|nr:molecular chaperone HtpG [Eubacteriales bacterium]MDY4213812.1 molecular chaperone HtpG [Eubacteriales bacterium]